jgi:predicted DNA-binding transcriptional regulator YafY
MLKLIPKEPASISAKDLHLKLKAAGYSITKRTVERDVIGLLEAGFPLIVDDSEQPFLWSWSKASSGFHAPRMSVSDALLTVMAAESLQDLLPSVVSESLLDLQQEAERTLNAAQESNQLSSWKNKIAVKSPSQPLIPPPIDPEVKAVCYEALLQDEQVSIVYASHSKDTGPKKYIVNPLGLIQRGWMSYLVVTFDGYEDIRLIALSRIKAAERTFNKIKKPRGFRLDAYVKQGFADFGDGQTMRLRATISEELRKHLEESRLSENQFFEILDGKTILNATVPLTHQLTWWIKSWGEHLQLLD